MSSWKEKLTDLVPYEPGEQIERAGVIKLNANENPYPPSPAVMDVIKNFQYEDLRKYPPLGDNNLRSVIAHYHNMGTENVLAGNSSDEVLAMCFRAFFNSDLPVLFPNITYSFYPVWCRLFDITYEEITLPEDFFIQIKDYNIQNGGIIIPNPNAPTGICMDIELIDSLVRMNPDSVVIIDEAYADFGDVSAISLIKKYDNLLVVRTVSKSRSLAGLRVGYAIGSDELIRALEATMDSFNAYPLSSLSMAVTIASFEDEAYFKETVNNVKLTRDWVRDRLIERGFVLTNSQANFLFMTHKRIKSDDLYKYLFGQDILVRHFDSDLLRNYLRVSVGTDEEMKTFVDAVDKYMEDKKCCSKI